MATAREFILKKIAASVKRKKEVANNLTRNKALYPLVVSFFEDVKSIGNDPHLTYLATNKFLYNIRNAGIDNGDTTAFYHHDDENPKIEIKWSDAHVKKYNCEPIMVIDEASATFQVALDEIPDN